MKHHIIYIPGLGDKHPYGQNIILKYWRFFGIHAHYLALGWRTKDSFDEKVKRVTDKIDILTAQGHRVSLCGTSAGASAVLAAYTLRPHISVVITIAGKIQRHETIWQEIRDKNPDFYEGARQISHNIGIISKRDDLKNILCFYSHGDKTVPPRDAIITGAKTKSMPGWSHKSGIFFSLILGPPVIARFLRRKGRDKDRETQ